MGTTYPPITSICQVQCPVELYEATGACILLHLFDRCKIYYKGLRRLDEPSMPGQCYNTLINAKGVLGRGILQS